LERRGRELITQFVQRGGGLLIAAGPDTDGEVVADTLGDPKPLTLTMPVGRDVRPPDRQTFAPADVRHPIFQPFVSGAASLALVKIQRAATIRSGRCATIARFAGGDAALIDCSPGEGRALMFASDLDNRWNDFPLHATFVPFVHQVVRYLGSARSAASEFVVGDASSPVAVQTPGVRSVENDGVMRLIAVNVDARESDPAR